MITICTTAYAPHWEPSPWCAGRCAFWLRANGQSHQGYRQGWGSDADGGVQYLITPDIEVDAEEGVRLQGSLGGFNNYTGVGIGLMF